MGEYHVEAFAYGKPRHALGAFSGSVLSLSGVLSRAEVLRHMEQALCGGDER